MHTHAMRTHTLHTYILTWKYSRHARPSICAGDNLIKTNFFSYYLKKEKQDEGREADKL